MKVLKNFILSLAVGLAFTVSAAGAFAATLNVVGGQLHGASGVDVDGTLYDVEFLDGTCDSVYNTTCNSTTVFTFTNLIEATAASQALLDQVFLDDIIIGLFDTDPELTFGINYSGFGHIVTPYSSADDYILASTARNSNIVLDMVNSLPIDHFNDFSTIQTFVFARWTSVSVVPLPATLPLFGAGIAVMGFIGWRRRRNKA